MLTNIHNLTKINILMATIIMTQPLMSNELTYSKDIIDLNKKYLEYIEQDFQPKIIISQNETSKKNIENKEEKKHTKNAKFEEFKDENKKTFKNTTNLVKDIIKSNMRG